MQTVIFKTLSGDLTVEKQNDLLMMDFPSFPLKSVPVTEKMVEALGVKPVAAYYGADMVCVLENEEQILNVRPSQDLIRQLDGVCLHITAPGRKYDCVTRTFAPKCNVAEDPVCGRGHCHVIPYWAVTTGKGTLRRIRPRLVAVCCIAVMRESGRYCGARRYSLQRQN